MPAAVQVLPNGATPVPVSSDTAELLPRESAALLSYTIDHPSVEPSDIALMLARTRQTRRYRAVVAANGRDDLLEGLRALADQREHPSLIRSTEPAIDRKLAFVFPGQGSQRPGMGRIFYDSVSAYRAEADRCAEAFLAHTGRSPLPYLLDGDDLDDRTAAVVQPALFTQMAALAAMWQDYGVTATATIGHSQGEIAAAYVSGATSLADAARLVDIRARFVDEIDGSSDRHRYAMAVVAAGRAECEELLARCDGWAEISVINAPGMTGISGQRHAILDLVDALTERGTFAKVIDVRYPAHTSLMNRFGAKLRETIRQQVGSPAFLNSETPCYGATLGGALSPTDAVDQYWFWNLRNPVRFDKAVLEAVSHGIDMFIELAEHPVLESALHQNIASSGDHRTAVVIGTSVRDSAGLDEFSRQLARYSVSQIDHRWGCRADDPDGAPPLPLPDFPNTITNDIRLWLPYEESPRRVAVESASEADDPEVKPAQPDHRSPGAPAAVQLLTEKWVPLPQRRLSPPRRLAILDYGGRSSALVDALRHAGESIGATVRVLDSSDDAESGSANSYVVLLPPASNRDLPAVADEVASFFANRDWWPTDIDAVTECWLVSWGAEAVVAADPAPDPLTAAISAGFRSIGAEYRRTAFRHLDLPAQTDVAEIATTALMALHTSVEPELAVRGGHLYGKRVSEESRPGDGSSDGPGDGLTTGPFEHVLITGGTGNLGLEFCEYLAARGARRITLVSRSGDTAPVADRVDGIRASRGTAIEIVSCDIGDPSAVSLLAERCTNAPVDLLVHAAGRYSDYDLAEITSARARDALHAKVAGLARVLDTVPRKAGCRVLLCSSLAATIGGRGQALYAAANRTLDVVAHRLRADGVECSAIQWGQWTVANLDEAGMAKTSAAGLFRMQPADALAVGMTLSGENAIVAAFDPVRAQSVLGTYGYGPLLSELTPGRDRPRPPQPVVGDLKHHLTGLLAGTIGVESAETIDVDTPMVALGLDSLQALEFRRRVQAELDHDLAVADLLGGASIADVLTQLGR